MSQAPPEPLSSEAIVKPEDCVMVFGIPTSDAEYQEQRWHPAPRDFAARVCKSRIVFFNHVEKFSARYFPCYRKLGVKLICAATLESFGQAFAGGPKVVTLFSHWQKDPALIEFFDGMKTPEEVNSVIPADFDGIIDWCVCHPALLALRRYGESAHLRIWKNYQITPGLWLWFYYLLFDLLKTNPTDFVSAYIKAAEIAREIF